MTVIKNEKIQKYLSIVYAVTIIAIMNPFFLWDGYRNGIFSGTIPVLKIFYVLAIILGIAYCVKENSVKRDKFYLVIFLLVCLLIMEIICGNKLMHVELISIQNIMNFVIVGLFCVFPEKIKCNIYRYCLLFFVISIIPGIIYSILTFSGINFSFETLNAVSEVKQNSYVTYLHSPFAVQISKTYDLVGNLNRFRLCGIYDEPGRVGTTCALFLCAENLNLKKDWKNKVLVIGGILSLSLAFFFITLACFLIKMIQQKKTKYVLWIIAGIIACIVFMNIDFHNVALSSLQNRLVFTSNGLAGNNRTDSMFDTVFSSFLHDSELLTLIFGNGDGAMYRYAIEHGMTYASSYKCIIYDIGVLGSLLYVLWLFAFGLSYWKKAGKKGFILMNLIIFLLNLYQRPSIFNPSYLLITLSGIAMYCYSSNKWNSSIVCGGDV